MILSNTLGMNCPFMPLLDPGGYQQFVIPWFVSVVALISTSFAWLSLALLCVFRPLCSKDKCHWILGPPPSSAGSYLDLITSIQILFPNEATLSGSGGYDFIVSLCGGTTHSPTLLF